MPMIKPSTDRHTILHRLRTVAGFWVRTATALLGILTAMSSARADEAGDFLRSCAAASDQTACAESQARFRTDWATALKGEYVGQSNVASFLDAGWDGAVTVNRPLSCAWRIVLLSSGSTKITDNDGLKYDLLCKRKLSATELGIARSQAQDLYRRVYGRALINQF